VIIAPRFGASSGDTGNGGGACRDTLAQGEADWNCEVQRPNSWRSGGSELGGKGVTSYDYIDELLHLLSRREIFPNLRAIVFAGHSAGAQFVIRYQMSNRIQKLGIPCFVPRRQQLSLSLSRSTTPNRERTAREYRVCRARLQSVACLESGRTFCSVWRCPELHDV